MNKTEEYLAYIEDSLKLDDGTGKEMHTRLIKIWARLSEYLYYSDVTFEKFNREMGYDHFDNDEESDEEKDEESDVDTGYVEEEQNDIDDRQEENFEDEENEDEENEDENEDENVEENEEEDIEECEE